MAFKTTIVLAVFLVYFVGTVHSRKRRSRNNSPVSISHSHCYISLILGKLVLNQRIRVELDDPFRLFALPMFPLLLCMGLAYSRTKACLFVASFKRFFLQVDVNKWNGSIVLISLVEHLEILRWFSIVIVSNISSLLSFRQLNFPCWAMDLLVRRSSVICSGCLAERKICLDITAQSSQL